MVGVGSAFPLRGRGGEQAGDLNRLPTTAAGSSLAPWAWSVRAMPRRYLCLFGDGAVVTMRFASETPAEPTVLLPLRRNWHRRLDHRRRASLPCARKHAIASISASAVARSSNAHRRPKRRRLSLPAFERVHGAALRRRSAAPGLVPLAAMTFRDRAWPPLMQVSRMVSLPRRHGPIDLGRLEKRRCRQGRPMGSRG